MFPEQDETMEVLATHTNGAANEREPVGVAPGDPEAFVTELSAATPYFEAHGTIQLRIGTKVDTLKIRTVAYNALRNAAHASEPRIPKVRDRQGAFVKNVEHPAVVEWDESYAYLKVILGLVDVTLRDRQHHVVWTPQDTEAFLELPVMGTREKQVWGPKLLASVQALRHMKITVGHVNAICAAMDDLAKADEPTPEEVEDFLDR